MKNMYTLVTSGFYDGLGDKGAGEINIENRFVYFMNFIVARRIVLLSVSLMESFPYKYNLSSSDI